MPGMLKKLFNSYLCCFILSIGNTKLSAKVYRERERDVGHLLFCKYNTDLMKCILMCQKDQHYPSVLQDRKQCCCYDAKEIHGNKRKIWQGLFNILFTGIQMITTQSNLLRKNGKQRLIYKSINH